MHENLYVWLSWFSITRSRVRLFVLIMPCSFATWSTSHMRNASLPIVWIGYFLLDRSVSHFTALSYIWPKRNEISFYGVVYYFLKTVDIMSLVSIVPMSHLCPPKADIINLTKGAVSLFFATCPCAVFIRNTYNKFFSALALLLHRMMQNQQPVVVLNGQKHFEVNTA